jgi:hypothetical protein
MDLRIVCLYGQRAYGSSPLMPPNLHWPPHNGGKRDLMQVSQLSEYIMSGLNTNAAAK